MSEVLKAYLQNEKAIKRFIARFSADAHIAWPKPDPGMPREIADAIIAKREQYASDHIDTNNIKLFLDSDIF